MNQKKFRRIVSEALDTLPLGLRERIRNVEVIVDDDPTDEQIRSTGLDPETDTLFGIYEGVPLTEREHNFGMVLPDRITIFYRPLLDAFGDDPDEIREEIRTTVVHEIAHFFGLDDDEIEDLGY